MSTLAEALATTLITTRETIRTAIVESCPVPMLVADHQGSWVHVNAPYQALLACASDEVIGARWLDTLTPASRSRVEKVWEHIVRHRIGVRHLPVEHVHSSGRVVVGFMDVGFVPVDGFVGWFVPVCADPVECPMHEHVLRNIFKREPVVPFYESAGTNISGL